MWYSYEKIILGLVILCFSAFSVEKPNIIFIMADDLGYTDLGCYGQEKIQTPNLNRMANEGMKFTQCYTVRLYVPLREVRS